MRVDTAARVKTVKEYYFSTKLKEIAQLRGQGKPVINLGIGSPDLPPHESVRKVMAEESLKNEGHGYQSYAGIPELRTAFSDWYRDKYQVTVDPARQVMPLIGSKEGIMHISMTYLEEGDEVLVPDPGYPTYQSASRLSGAALRSYALTEENGWLPDLEKIAEQDLSRVKLMWVNYPHMPTGATADKTLWKALVDFGRKYQILICHDNPYSFILNPEPASIFSVPGAWECCLELNSLSKSHNMAGWRVGALVGDEKYLREIIKFKSNMDSGMFRSTQIAAVTALGLGDDWYDSLNQIYEKRKNIAYEILEILGCRFERNQAGLFVWGKVPVEYEDGYAMSDEALYEADVFITPGGIFGEGGQKYIRISVCMEEEVLDEARQRLVRVLENKNQVK